MPLENRVHERSDGVVIFDEQNGFIAKGRVIPPWAPLTFDVVDSFVMALADRS